MYSRSCYKEMPRIADVFVLAHNAVNALSQSPLGLYLSPPLARGFYGNDKNCWFVSVAAPGWGCCDLSFTIPARSVCRRLWLSVLPLAHSVLLLAHGVLLPAHGVLPLAHVYYTPGSQCIERSFTIPHSMSRLGLATHCFARVLTILRW